MSYPKGARFSDRIAQVGGQFWFVCQRKRSRSGHGRIVREFAHKADAVAFRSQHDALEHTSLGIRLQSHLLPTIRTMYLGIAAEKFIAEMEELVADGKRHPKTLAHYREVVRYLLAGFGFGFAVHDINKEKIRGYIRWRFKHGRTGGDRIIKELKALQTIMRFSEVGVTWRIPHDDIRPEKKERPRRDPETLLRFLAAMPVDSVERAFVATKLRTGMRNAELYDLRCRNVDLKAGVVRFILHNKRRPMAHTQPIRPDLAGVLRPFVDGKRAGDLVFTISGRQLQESSLRKRFIAASRAAGIDPPILSVGDLRHWGITAASDRLGVKDVSRAIGHRSVSTTAGYLLNDGSDEAKNAVAATLAEIIPL
jgi:integrase